MPNLFERLKKKSKQADRKPLPFSVTQPEVPVRPPAAPVAAEPHVVPIPSSPALVPTSPTMPLGISPALHDWQDFPPGIATPADCTYIGQAASDKCEMCGAESRRNNKRVMFIDPIPQVRILEVSKNPLEPPKVAYRERGLCPQCYSKRYSQRYPGITPKGIPD